MLNFLRFAVVRGKHLSVFFYSALNTGQKHFLDNFRRTYRKRVTEQIIYVLCYEEIVFFSYLEISCFLTLRGLLSKIQSQNVIHA